MAMFLPVAGVCPAGTVAVYRVFSNRPDANHRYMIEAAVRATWSRWDGSPRATVPTSSCCARRRSRASSVERSF